MLRFDVYRDGAPATAIDLAGAYTFGQDSIPVRADLAAAEGQITCIKRVPGACGLTLLWDAKPAGQYLLSTTRLPERNEPYNLNVELVRAQLMRLVQKREDWGLFDYGDARALNDELHDVRKRFIESLKTSDPADASRVADAALADAVTLGEKFALFHAEAFLNRRIASGGGSLRPGFGCTSDLLSAPENYHDLLRDSFDYISVPVPWKTIESKERQYDYAPIDAWVNWASRNRRYVHMGPLLSFDPVQLPKWLYIWEHDYDTLRDMIYEHIQKIVNRYERHVRVWNVVSGIHACNTFNLSFEQLMELTRMCCLLVKKLAPRSQVLVELCMPWGEYYSRNQRTIPPLLYADMAVQSGIKFDAFGLQMMMGVPVDGFYVRDLMQISTLLDEFVTLDKSVHVTACQAPSDITTDPNDAWSGQHVPAKAGQWHTAWSQRLQAEWLQAFYRIAMSKPFVETICWRDLSDREAHYLPHGGLCRGPGEPKLAHRELRNFRAALVANSVMATRRGNPTTE